MSRRDPPEVRQRRGSPEPVPGKCGGHLTMTDPPRYCLEWPRKGRDRCKLHGGNTLVGIEHPSLKHGRTSKYAYLSPATAQSVEAALADEALMDLTGDVALLEALKEDAARNWDVGVSAEAWQEVRKIAKALHRATSETEMREQIEKLRQVVGKSYRSQSADKLAEVIEKRSKLVTARQKLMVETEHLIPATRVGLVMAGVAALVREFIPDDERQREFTLRFIGYVGSRLRPSSVTGRTLDAAAVAADDTTGD